MFCGSHGDRVTYEYTVRQMAYVINEFSDFPIENEVLLEPMCCFTVKEVVNLCTFGSVLPHVGVDGGAGLCLVAAEQDDTGCEVMKMT